MSDVIPIPTKESLADGDLHEVRWLEAAFVEANYTVEYANYVQHHRLVEPLASALRSRPTATAVDRPAAGRTPAHRRVYRDGREGGVHRLYDPRRHPWARIAAASAGLGGVGRTSRVPGPIGTCQHVGLWISLARTAPRALRSPV